jgi:hypothetical protein
MQISKRSIRTAETFQRKAYIITSLLYFINVLFFYLKYCFSMNYSYYGIRSTLNYKRSKPICTKWKGKRAWKWGGVKSIKIGQRTKGDETCPGRSKLCNHAERDPRVSDENCKEKFCSWTSRGELRSWR